MLAWVEELLSSSKSDPFIAYIGPLNGMYPYTPASWYSDAYKNGDLYPNLKEAPRTPNFNSKTSNHHGFVNSNPELEDNAVKFVDQIYIDRVLSLLSIDDIVGALFDVLNKYKALSNTYVIYTSANGYHLGQFRVPCEKGLPYETGILCYYIVIHSPLFVVT